jgi:hypothetical protein
MWGFLKITAAVLQALKERSPATRLGQFELPDLLLSVPMMRRCCGCRTVKRVKTAGLGNTAAMMHYLRTVNARGTQWADEHDG